MSAKIHTFKVGDIIATWHDTGAFGATIVFGLVIAAGPKTYRMRWESGHTNRLEQGRTICWLHDDWKDYTDAELARIEESLGTTINRAPARPEELGMRIGQLVQVTSRRTFRIGIITHGGVVPMVAIWRDNGGTWTRPQQHIASTLEPIDRDQLDARKRRVVERARAAVDGGWVRYKNGETHVGAAVLSSQAPPARGPSAGPMGGPGAGGST